MPVSSDTTNAGAILFSLVLSAVLYGVGVSQTWLYFQWWPADGWANKVPVVTVFLLESAQLVSFFTSVYIKDLDNENQLILADLVQLLCTYLSASIVQVYFCTRILRLLKGHRGLPGIKMWSLGPYVAMILSLFQLSAGFCQAVISYRSDSYAKLESTRVVTILQTAASLACDVVITGYLCLFLGVLMHGQLNNRTMLKTVIVSAINRGMATAMFSAATVVLFVAFPETYLFLIALAPSGKIYAVTLLSNLNTRMHPRDQMVNNGVELHSVPAGTRVSAHAQAFIAVPDTRNPPTSPPNSAQSDDLAFEKAR